jgi:hypothetical protein
VPSDDSPDTTTWQCSDCGRKQAALSPDTCPRCDGDEFRPVDVDVPGADRGEVRTESFDVNAATASLGNDGSSGRPGLLRRLVRRLLGR